MGQSAGSAGAASGQHRGSIGAATEQRCGYAYDEAVDQRAVEDGDGARVIEQRRRQQAVWPCVHLPRDEGGAAQRADDAGREGSRQCPGTLRAAQRDADEQAGRAADEQERTEPVHPPRPCLKRKARVADEELRSQAQGRRRGS